MRLPSLRVSGLFRRRRQSSPPPTPLRRALAVYLVVYLLTGGGLLPAAWAETFYVDAVNGDDDVNDGSMGSPWQRLGRALDEAADGDIIVAAAGVYDDESFPLQLISGVTLSGAGSEAEVGVGNASVIRHDGRIMEAINVPLSNETIVEGFTLDGMSSLRGTEDELILLSATFSSEDGQAIEQAPIIRNNEFRNAPQLIRGDFSDRAHEIRPEIRDNVFADYGWDAILFEASELYSEDLDRGPGYTVGEFSPIIEGNEFTPVSGGESGQAVDIFLQEFVRGEATIRDNQVNEGEASDYGGVYFQWSTPNGLEELPFRGDPFAADFDLVITDNVFVTEEDGIDIEVYWSDEEESEGGEGGEVFFDALISRNQVTVDGTGIDVFIGDGWLDAEDGAVDFDVQVLDNEVMAGERGVETVFVGVGEGGPMDVLGNFTVAGNTIALEDPDSISITRGEGGFGAGGPPGDAIYVEINSFTWLDEADIDATIQNNEITAAYDDGIQIFLHSSSFSPSKDRAGTAEAATRGGIRYSTNVTAAGNAISGVADNGIEVVKGPAFTDPGKFRGGEEFLQSVQLLGNEITGAPNHGVYIEASTTTGDSESGDVDYDYNTLMENVITDGSGYGFAFDQQFERIYDQSGYSALIAECNTITGNPSASAVFYDYGNLDRGFRPGYIDWGGGPGTPEEGPIGVDMSRGFNVFSNGVVRSDPYLFDNQAYSEGEGGEGGADIFAQNNFWGDGVIISSVVNGAVDFTNELDGPPMRSVSVSLTSSIEEDNGMPGLTPGDIIEYQATIVSDGDCGCAAADFTAPVPEGGILVEDSVRAFEELRGEPGGAGIDLSDPEEGLVRVGLGSLGHDQVIEVVWQVELQGCSATVQAQVACTQVGTALSEEITDQVEVTSVSVTKTDGLTEATPGTPHQYTIDITGAACPVTGASVTDDLPDELLDPTWTCTASPGSTCTAEGMGDITDTVDIAADGTLTYVIDSIINTTASGTLTNTVDVDAPIDEGRGGSLGSSTDETLLLSVPPPSISAVKTVGGVAEVDGTLTYQIVLTNTSPTFHPDNPSDEFVDVLPPELQLIGAVADSGVITTGANSVMWNGQIPGNGTVTIDIEALVLPAAEGMEIENQGVVSVDTDLNGSNETDQLTDDPVPPGSADPTVVAIGQSILEIPTLGRLGGALMVLLLSGCAVLVIGRRFGA